MDTHLLSLVLFTPIAGLIVLLFIPSSQTSLIRLWANVVSFAGFLISTACLCAQSSVTSSTQVDVNGHRIPNGPEVITSKSGNDTQTTVTMQSINGRQVPLERVEEKVVREDASGRVVERLIRRYDPQGTPTPPER